MVDILKSTEVIDKLWLQNHVTDPFREELFATLEDSHESYFKVSVKDTGIGIERESFKNIFSSFQQEDTSTTKKYGGTGLGLSMSKKILDLHKGSLWLDSQVGKGSIFTFILPILEGQNRLFADSMVAARDKAIS